MWLYPILYTFIHDSVGGDKEGLNSRHLTVYICLDTCIYKEFPCEVYFNAGELWQS